MATYFSFLTTLQNFAKGVLTPKEDDYYVFNCRRDRVLRSDESIPGYVSQMNHKQEHLPNDFTLSLEQLHPNTLKLWLQLKPILAEAD